MHNIDIDNIWDEIEPELKKIIKQYKIKLTIQIILHIIIFVLSAYFALTQLIPHLGDEANPGFYLSMVIPNMIFWIFCKMIYDIHVQQLKQFYNICLKPFNITHTQYKSNFFEARDIVRTKIFGCTGAKIDDIFTGTYNGISFEIAEIKLYKTRGSRYTHVVFKGNVLLINNFIDSINGTISADTMQLLQNYTNEMNNTEAPNSIAEFEEALIHLNCKGYILNNNIIMLFMNEEIFQIKNLIDKTKLYLHIYTNNFEVSKINPIKEDFEKLINEIFDNLKIIDKLIVKEKYRYLPLSLNSICSQRTSKEIFHDFFMKYIIIMAFCDTIIPFSMIIFSFFFYNLFQKLYNTNFFEFVMSNIVVIAFLVPLVFAIIFTKEGQHYLRKINNNKNFCTILVLQLLL